MNIKNIRSAALLLCVSVAGSAITLSAVQATGSGGQLPDQAKTQLFDSFTEKVKKNSPEAHRAAYELAKRYLQKYEKDNDQTVSMVREFIAIYEQETAEKTNASRSPAANSKLALYESLMAKVKENTADSHRAAYSLAKQYLQSYGADKDNRSLLVSEFVQLYETGSSSNLSRQQNPKAREDLFKKFMTAFEQKNQTGHQKALTIGREYLSRYAADNDARVAAVKEFVELYQRSLSIQKTGQMQSGGISADKRILYEAFMAKYQVNTPESHRKAYQLAVQFLQKYGKDNDSYSALVKEFVDLYGAAAPK